MPIVSATEVTVYSNISASAATISASGKIPIVQANIAWITNNWFTSDLYLQDLMTFNATDRTIIASNSFASQNFAADDDIYIYRSYRNDGYFTLSSVSGTTLTLISGSAITPELSGRSILISVVQWPTEIKQTAALMVEYDTDSRKTRTPGVLSRSLGPWRESYSAIHSIYGYPTELVAALQPYAIARLM